MVQSSQHSIDDSTLMAQMKHKHLTLLLES